MRRLPRRWTILIAYFLLGGYAVAAQAMLLREAQVLLFGSELSWGLVLAFWLSGVALGAHLAGRRIERARRPGLVLGVAGLAMPLVLVGEVVLLRVARPLLGVGPGQYVGLGPMVAVAAAAAVPVSVWVGLAFPAASALVGREALDGASKARAVGWVYLAESAGSLVGGALWSFVGVSYPDVFWVIVGPGSLVAAAMVLVVADRTARVWLIGVAGLAAVGLALLQTVVYLRGAERVSAGTVGWEHALNRWTILRRWESFAPGLELETCFDTRHQNVAVGRLQDQFSLYTNGTVAATWPNPYELAVEAHLMACQHPSPRRILVLGGGLEGLLKELLAHGPDRLDLVMLDERPYEAVYARLPEADRRAADAVRPTTHFTDARRFVKRNRAAGRPPYDLVVLAASEPSSVLEARLYTEEFFAELAGAMADDGVLAFSLTGSVGHWGPEASHYVGSIVAPLVRVFPDVLLTFGATMHVFAARSKDVLTADGGILARRYEERGVASDYFDPLWFEGASDLLDAAKRADLRARLARHPPRLVNTDERPAAALYRMVLWQRTTGAAHAGADAPPEDRAVLLESLLDLRMEWVLAAVAGATTLAALAGAPRGRRGLRTGALLWSVGTTGFAGMAVEIVLLYTFQTLYGYVYSMVGLVIGVFMAGLVAGSYWMTRRLRRTRAEPRRRPGLGTVLALDVAVAVFAAGLVIILALLRTAAADWPVQVATFALVAVAGMLGGLVFPLAAAVFVRDRPETGRAAGAIDAADHVGACAGALVTGVVLVPVLGVSGTCLVVASLKVASGLFVACARLTSAGPRTAALGR